MAKLPLYRLAAGSWGPNTAFHVGVRLKVRVLPPLGCPALLSALHGKSAEGAPGSPARRCARGQRCGGARRGAGPAPARALAVGALAFPLAFPVKPERHEGRAPAPRHPRRR
eukprot:2550520-Pyramimonas_sp.AAC.1